MRTLRDDGVVESPRGADDRREVDAVTMDGDEPPVAGAT
jgi:hypothetical protein